jgi:hypothetical protein
MAQTLAQINRAIQSTNDNNNIRYQYDELYENYYEADYEKKWNKDRMKIFVHILVTFLDQVRGYMRV